jgi:CRISPR-associated endonuclease Csn1
MDKNDKNIYLGLDIGTDSCGWALVDDSYNIVRVRGKEAWGVRLFDDAQVAQDRRLKRTTRRRLQRKRLQGEWLKEIFAKEINKVDPSFFDRLKYSNLFKEDKEKMGVNCKYSLFNDVLKDVYTDKEYYKTHKTVYHLREALLTKPADDVRLLYLAVHSFLTHRGHFLYEMGESNEIDIPLIHNKMLEKFGEIDFEDGQNLNLKKVDMQVFVNLYDDFKKGYSIREIKENFANNIGAVNKREKNLAKVIVAGKFKLKDLFEVDKDDNIDIDFSGEKYENETKGKIFEILGDDDKSSIIDDLQTIYSAIQLKKLLGEHKYICEAMVAKYELHNAQLKEFKEFISQYYPSKKSYVFRSGSDKLNNYAHYVYQTLTNGKKQVLQSKAKKDDFYAFVKKVLDEKPETPIDDSYEESKAKIISLMEKGEFLQKIRSHDNTVLPNSLYLNELRKILNVSSQKYDFLKEIDEDNLSGAEKILQIISFKVPYYVGPIGESKPEFSWANKKIDMSLRPWNLDKIVNLNEAEDGFIQRMTNKCTYLKDKDVLPKDSILYSKFRVLNELNNLKINGDSISVTVKQSIFNNLFKKEKKVTVKKLLNFLVAENVVSEDKIKEVAISGIDKEFANNYASYITFTKRFGEKFVEDNIEVFEKIIKYHTIISDKSRLQERIKREFDIFSSDDIKWLKSLNFSKWGRLSKEFLQDVLFADRRKQENLTIRSNFSDRYIEKLRDGEVYSVIEALWETNNNLQQLFDTSNYTLAEVIEKSEQQLGRELTYLDIDEMYCSPAVKRGAWQAIKIVNEIKSAIGRYPDKIFVEVTRHDSEKGEKGRKDSRKKNLEKLYNDADLKAICKQLSVEYDVLINELNDAQISSLRSDKLFLYFLQLGKCMYTGETIDIADLYDDNKYNVDHIIPQSKIKDDSLNNKVLVKMIANKEKDNYYPISEIKPDWQIKQKHFWRMLNEKGLLSDEKLSRLERTEPFNEREEIDFVNRQLVETNQESKAVIDLLRKVVNNPTDVVFSKANIVSDFRKKYSIYKSRSVNSLHHAKDAYLNVVVGNVVYNRFTARFWDRKGDDKNASEHVTRNFSKLFEGKVWASRGNQLVWDKDRDLVKVEEQCSQNNCIVSIMPFVNSNGGFYDETIYKSTKNDPHSKASFALKGEGKILSDIEKYGGYNSLKGAYFMVVESENKKGKTKKTIENVPIIIAYKYRDDPNKQEKIAKYIEEQNNIKITKIILPVLKYKSTLKINGSLYTLTGKSLEKVTLLKQTQWFVDNKTTGYVKAIEKYLAIPENIKTNLTQTDEYIIVSPAGKNGNREIRLTRQENIGLYDLAIKQLSKKIYNLSSTKGVLNTLIKSRDKFVSLSLDKQASQLNEIVGYLGGSYDIDLTLLGGAGQAGTTKINKNITDLNIKVVMQTSAGLNKKEIKL